ncbi:MAG: hypothetical protein ABIK37_00670 [candidate division WOR-3 bacterium]
MSAVLAAGITVVLAGCGTREVVWTTTIDVGTDEVAAALCADRENLYVVGTQANPQTGRSIWLLQVLDRRGRLVRRQTFVEGAANIAADAALRSDGGLFICGRSVVRDTTICLVIDWRPNGTVAFKRGLVMGEHSWASGVCALEGSRAAVCGAGIKGQECDMFVAVLDSTGRTVWAKNYDFSRVERAHRICAAAGGSLVVLGQTKLEENCPDILVAKLNSRGETLWTRRYDSGGADEPGAIAVDRFGNVIVVGTARVNDSSRCVILEYDPDGGAVRKVAFGEQAMAEGNAIAVTEKGDIYVAGAQVEPQGRTVLAYHYLPNATTVWERHVKLGADATAAALVGADDIYVAATVQNATKDIAVVRLSRPVTEQK